MSIVNLGRQCVGLARTEMDEENERFAARAGSMKESRSVAAKHPGFKEAFFKIQWLLLKSLWLSSFKITAQGKGFQGFHSCYR